METITISTTKQEMHDISSKVREIVKNSGVDQGICLVYTPHSTAGIVIACGIDPNALVDVNNFVNKMVPQDTTFKHTCDPTTDAAGHLKSILTNAEHCFPIAEGEIQLGSSQEIYFYEFDGPRERKVYVEVVGK
ncbi:MAG: secondary thiamine-phosphate synthase enzyme YjbQ [Christensenellaceae bacterium]